MHAILKYSDTRLWLTGSFPTKDAACEHGAKWQAANGDDPRWQYIDLPYQPGVTYRKQYIILVEKAPNA